MQPRKRWPARHLDFFLLVATALILGVFVLYPTLRLFMRSMSAWHWAYVFASAGRTALINTLLVAAASVLAAGLFGTALAFLMTRFAFPGRRVASALAYLPFTLPPLVGVLSFYYLVGPDGFLPRIAERLTGLDMAGLHGFWAIVLIHTYAFYVFFYAMVSAALENLDQAQVEAARTLGASHTRVFWRVTVPQLRPALAGAALLTYMSATASFSAPYFFGKGFRVLTVLIYEEQSGFHQERAFVLTVVLAVAAFLGVVLFRTRRHASGPAAKGVRVTLRSKAARWTTALGAWGVVALLVAPHAIILWLAFVDHRAWQSEIVPTQLTLDNFRVLLQDPATFAPIRNSLWMSAFAAVGTFAVGLPAAYLIARHRSGARWLNALVMLPWALPGTVIAMNLIVAFNDPWIPVYSALWMLPLAYFVRSVPLFTRMAAAVIEPFDGTLVEAGRTLGASRRYCFLRVILPLIAPGLIAATALVFALSLGEFVASILLYTPANLPIAVKINMEWRGAVGTAFAYSVFLMVLVTATFIAARRVASRSV